MLENFKPKFSKKTIKVVGCGLAGAEVALVLAGKGFDVHIFDNGREVSKEKFGYYDPYETYLTENMKYELECLDSPLFSIAKRYNFTDFGFAYNDKFMEKVRETLQNHPNIKIFKANIDRISENETTVIATGHKTGEALLTELERFVGRLHYCFDQNELAVIDAQSVDLKKLYFEGDTCFANLSETEYENFYNKVCEIDKSYYCQPNAQTIESIVKRGKNGLKNSVLRAHFSISQKPYASLKLIYKPHFKVLLPEFNSAFSEEEQLEVLSTIDVLKGCKLLRPAKIRKRTYLLSPAVLHENMSLAENLYVCGGFAGTAGSFESLLMANYCAYNIICDISGKSGVDLLQENTCIAMILENLLKKSVINFRLFNLKYDIMNMDDADLRHLDKCIGVQKILSRSQIEKFKEKFYGKYF